MILLIYPLTFFFAASALWWNKTPWIYFFILGLFMGLTIIHFKNKHQTMNVKEHINLSHEAKEMLRKFNHIYETPFASRQYASICSVAQLAGVFVLLVNLYHEFYLGLLFALINWYFFAYAAYYFNPILWFEKNNELHVHNEIVEFLENKGWR